MRVLRGGTVVDADGGREADVGIETGEIVAVEPPGSIADADEQLVVDGYLAPGLIDAHVHLTMDGRPDPETFQAIRTSGFAYLAAASLGAFLDAGVTTVRDLGANGAIAVEARNAVRDGVLEGPRVVPAGAAITMTGGHGYWAGREADGPDEVRKAARRQLKHGAEVVKCMATGGVLTEGARPGAPELTERELRAAVEAARAKNVPSAAHAHGAAGIKNAVRAGITSVEHGTYMDEEGARLLARNDVYWVPTLKALAGIVKHGAEAGIPGWAVEKARDAADAMDDAFEYARDAGVEIAMGTDAGTPFNYHADAPEELSMLVERGLSPAEAFEAATVAAADLLGLDDVGLVREGYRADVVALGSDPREDPTAYRDPDLVVADGAVVRRQNHNC
jgi:imidazolonepropionase-like amidohydrolase